MPALQPIVRSSASAERPFRSADAQRPELARPRREFLRRASLLGKNGYGGKSRVPWSLTIASSKWTGHAAPQIHGNLMLLQNCRSVHAQAKGCCDLTGGQQVGLQHVLPLPMR